MENLRKKHYNATLIKRINIKSDLGIFRLRHDFSTKAHYLPGQYCVISLGNWEPVVPDFQKYETVVESPKLIQRCYSISHPMVNDHGELVKDTDYFEYYIQLVTPKEGSTSAGFTPRLFQCQEGDRVFLGKKTVGNYTLRTHFNHETIVFMSTGTGEAPHNAMIHHLLKTGFKGKIVSIVTSRYKLDLAYLGKYELLQKHFLNLIYIPLTTRDIPIEKKKYAQDLILTKELEVIVGARMDTQSWHFYLCGNPDFIGKSTVSNLSSHPSKKGTVQVLEEAGFKLDTKDCEGQIHIESYW